MVPLGVLLVILGTILRGILYIHKLPINRKAADTCNPKADVICQRAAPADDDERCLDNQNRRPDTQNGKQNGPLEDENEHLEHQNERLGRQNSASGDHLEGQKNKYVLT